MYGTKASPAWMHISCSAQYANVQVTWLLAAGVCSKIAASRGGKHHSEATKQKIGAGRSAVAKRKRAADAEKKKAAIAAQQTAEAAGIEAEIAR